MQVCQRHGKPIDPQSSTPPYSHRKGYCAICNVGCPTMTRTKANTPLVLWVRIGDGGSYEQYGQDLHAVADLLYEAFVKPPLHWFSGRVETDGYPRQNHVSLYWGDADANLVEDLGGGDRLMIDNLLGRLGARHD